MISLLFSEPLVFLIWVIAILIALSVHEFSHALVGTWLGDQTAKRLGRLTLNPAAHVDMFGFVALVVIGFGWGKPVPYNPYNLRNQKWGPTLIALAGPGMNLLMATVLGLILRIVLPVLGDSNLLIQFLFLSVYLNVALLLFNLLPIPPLDGSKLWLMLLDRPSTRPLHTFIETRGPTILLALILADLFLNIHIFSSLFSVINHFVRIVVGV